MSSRLEKLEEHMGIAIHRKIIPKKEHGFLRGRSGRTNLLSKPLSIDI